LHNIAVDREGEYAYTLRPKTGKASARLLCEITLKGHVKIVTLRSTFKVQNSTLFPLEVMLLDHDGHPAYAVEKVGEQVKLLFDVSTLLTYTDPGNDYALPIDVASDTRITLRPERKCDPCRFIYTELKTHTEGFGYKWSNALQWEDLMARPTQMVVCPHSQVKEPAWRLQAWAQYVVDDTVAR
jgi:vacuolar protein sorting-associated protein 13A/C